MKSTKGISLPITAIVVVGLALAVLASIVLLFTSTGGPGLSQVEAERIFATKCQTYCDKTDSRANILLSTRLKDSDPEFLQACGAKGISWKDSSGEVPLRCLAACPCDVSISTGEANSNFNCVAQCLDRCPINQPNYRACMDSCKKEKNC